MKVGGRDFSLGLKAYCKIQHGYFLNKEKLIIQEDIYVGRASVWVTSRTVTFSCAAAAAS